MRIAIIGATGQLGSDLTAVLRADVVPLGHTDVEIVDPASVDRALQPIQPDVIVNAAAYNFVDRAEDEPDSAFAVNALGPRNLSHFCRAHAAVLVHVSTDYVFGKDTARTEPYRETDPPEPVGAYGISKLAGEYFVQSGCPRHFVLRTCGLYGHAARRAGGKGNFVETMLRLASQRDELRIVDDQVCTPTTSAELARSIAALIETAAYGLYHATCAGSTTWCGFAREIFRQSNIHIPVKPITTAEFGAKATRPRYSALDCRKLFDATGFQFPDWQSALSTYLANRVLI